MTEQLEQELQDYKAKINPKLKATVTWDKDLIFIGRSNEGYEIEFDANVQWGCKPTDALLLSLGGCMAIDVLMFLQKMKCDIKEFKMTLEAERNPTPPQYFKAVDIHLNIKAQNIDANKVDRAIKLSHDKYCSVYNSLRPDLKVKTTYTLSTE